MKKSITLILLITVLALFLAITKKANAKNGELTIIYTGETHAMLYPCNCPIEPDGGVARRATLIKRLKLESPDVLILDSGNFSAGGPLDQQTLNAQIDKQRTSVYLNAMELMKYDAVALSDDEFNFGKDYLEASIGKVKLNFLSANLRAKGSLPYIIKGAAGFKIGIIGLTNAAAKNKAGDLKFVEPKSALAETVTSLKKKGVQLIILLSNLGEPEDLILLEKVPDIDVIIDGHSHEKDAVPYVKVGKTFILRPSWQGRRLCKASFTIKNNKLESLGVDEIRVSDKTTDDAAIQTILPRCFSDENCKKTGFIGSCENAASINSSCSFKEAKKILLTVITSKECLTCNTEPVVSYFKKQFAGLVVSYIYYPDKNAVKLIKDLKLIGLPVYLVSKEAEGESNFDSLKVNLEDKGSAYLLKPEVGGLTYFIGREKIEGKLDLFLSLYDKNTVALLDMIREFNPVLHFLVFADQGSISSPGGLAETEEDERAVCIQKYYPKYFWPYLTCRANNINSSWWEDCLSGADNEKIKSCARGAEGRALLKENCGLNKELRIMYGPTYLLNNQEIFTSNGVLSRDEFKRIIRR
ncbi:MAG: hypothetical protein NTZ63_04180 [Candidatus Omnitrophica bacterium]|nr:hypothetical protein [Candidatus Omnitrophota bacterium]